MTEVPVAGPRHSYPAGTLAVIVAVPADASHAYRVRLPDGFETHVTREKFVLLRTLQSDSVGQGAAALHDHELQASVIYRCVVGSRAYGLDTDDSDTDTRGIYLPPAHRHWSLYGVPEQLELPATDEVYWELQKFLVLALKANPNVLEVLYSPIVVHVTALAEELLAMRERFLSKLVYQTYNGYVMSQFRKLERRRATGADINWKHAMHLVRLLMSGIAVLREGVVPVRVRERDRRRLMAIRAGELSLDEVDEMRLALHREFDDVFVRTKLSDHPDHEAANDFLLRARRNALGER